MYRIMDLDYYYFVFEIAILALVAFGLAYLLALAFLVRDFKLIRSKPLIFIFELTLMAILPGIPILFFVVSRGISWDKAWIWFSSLSGKFAIFHILSEISGFYTWLFA